VKGFKAVKEERFNAEIDRIRREGFNTTSHIQWFNVQERFSPMGVKMIGLFCDRIKNMKFVKAQKYLAGFQVIPNKVPRFGMIEINQVKVSMRVSFFLERRIREGSTMGLNYLLPEATGRLGGFSDACHSLTAATTIDLGKEEKLIQEMEKLLKKEKLMKELK